MAVGLLVRSERVFARQYTDSCHYIDHLLEQAAKYQHRQLDTCFQYLSQAKGITKRIGDKAGEAGVYRGLGSYYAFRANSYLSFRFYLDALRLYKELHDSAGLCLVNVQLAVNQQFSGHHLEAVQYIRQALVMADRLHNDSIMVNVLSNYFFIFRNDTAHLEDARIALQRAHDMAKRNDEEGMLIYTGMLQADEQYDRGETEAATSKALELVHQALSKGLIYHALYGYSQLAGYSFEQHKGDSVFYQQEMIRLGLQGGYRELVLPDIANFYHYFEEQHNRPAAARYASLMADIIEQHQQSNTQGEQDYMDYYLQGKQLRQLQLQHDYQQQQLNRKVIEVRNRYVVIICLAILLVLLMLLLTDINRSYRRSRKNADSLGEMNRQISEQNALLRTHDDFKNKLISLIAHDFRSPLIQIIEITTYLKQGAFTLQEAAALFRRLESNVGNTLHIFENILRWIRTQLSGFVYQPTSCMPAALIREALLSLREVVEEKQVQVMIHISHDLQVLADKEMLQFVHRNLLHNAIKYSPEGGTIVVDATITEDTATVTITDEGKGIPEEILGRLFEYRTERASATQKYGGAGLALIICKDFMDKMGGDIQVISRPDKGCTFSYYLPCLKL